MVKQTAFLIEKVEIWGEWWQREALVILLEVDIILIVDLLSVMFVDALFNRTVPMQWEKSQDTLTEYVTNIVLISQKPSDNTFILGKMLGSVCGRTNDMSIFWKHYLIIW